MIDFLNTFFLNEEIVSLGKWSENSQYLYVCIMQEVSDVYMLKLNR